MKKALSILLALCMVLALTACSVEINVDSAVPAASDLGAFAQVDETHWEGGSLTVEAVEYADEYADYVDGTLFGHVSKIVYDGGEIAVDSELYTAILTVDGVQYDLYNAAGESFSGDCVVTLVEKGNSSSSGNSKFGDDAGSLIGPFAYAAAAYYGDDGYEEAKSATIAMVGGSVTEDGVSGVTFDSEGDYFSAVYASSGEITIADSDFTAYGKGGDDFTGQGCAVIATGEAVVTIDNCRFVTGGALRSAIWAGSKADVTVNDTLVQSYNDTELVPYTTEDNYATSMMQQVPFALGLKGNIRATLDCGQATIRFNNSLISSDGWAVLSTDSGSGTMISTDTVAVVGQLVSQPEDDQDKTFAVGDSEYTVHIGKVGELSGYIAYCDGFTDYAYGGEWYAPDYLAIITGGSFTVDQSENSRFYGWSDRIGFMSHKTSVSTLLDISHADFDVTDTLVMVKDAGGNGETINLNDVTVNLTGENGWSGKLLSFIDSDDLGGGPGATTFVIPYGSYEDYLSAGNNGAKGQVVMNITDSEIAGDIYNSVGSFNGTAFSEDSVTVNMTNSILSGVVSSSYGCHCDENGNLLVGDITVDSYEREGTYDYLVIGRMIDFAQKANCNPVSLNLVGSDWECTGLSYLAALTLDENSSVVGDVYVGGEKVELKAGTYEDVVVVPVGADLATAETAMVESIEAATAAGIVPEDMSSLVANTDMGSGSSSGEASGEADASEEPAASEEPTASEEPAAQGGDVSEDAYHAYLKEYVDAVPAVSDDQYLEFCALIDASDYTTMPADMMFDATWWGYAAMTFDEFVAAGGAYEIPAFDPSLTAD